MNDLFATDIERMSRHHITYIMFSLSREAVTAQQFRDPGVPAIINVLLRVYALKLITDDTQALYECGFFSRGSGKLINEALKATLLELRPQMVPLAELIDMESSIKSASGNYHGDIFESMLDFAKGSELNKDPIPPYYNKYMKPLIQGNGDPKFKLW